MHLQKYTTINHRSGPLWTINGGQHGVTWFGRQRFARDSDQSVLSQESISTAKNNQLVWWKCVMQIILLFYPCWLEKQPVGGGVWQRWVPQHYTYWLDLLAHYHRKLAWYCNRRSQQHRVCHSFCCDVFWHLDFHTQNSCKLTTNDNINNFLSTFTSISTIVSSILYVVLIFNCHSMIKM